MGTWLSGPGPFDAGDGSDGSTDASEKYPGQRLGLPQTGPGSLARTGRRIGALFLDWLVAYGLAGLAMAAGWVSMATLSTAVLVIWMVLGTVAVRLFSFTPGSSRSAWWWCLPTAATTSVSAARSCGWS